MRGVGEVGEHFEGLARVSILVRPVSRPRDVVALDLEAGRVDRDRLHAARTALPQARRRVQRHRAACRLACAHG
eukprot:3539532-Prymnesium_polylepis.2